LAAIQHNIRKIAKRQGTDPTDVALLAITKNHSLNEILPLLELGQRQFGENRVQEAYSKWPVLKTRYSNIELHLVGHLQTNKVKEAITLFDVIQTLDSLKLASRLAQEELHQQKKLSYYIEVNIGSEPQKTGVLPQDFGSFFKELRQNYPLNIIGVMCIPPKETSPVPYFRNLYALAQNYGLTQISMGMSNDYELAIQEGATQVRIGQALFKAR
jgi:PLP dependent protein